MKIQKRPSRNFRLLPEAERKAIRSLETATEEEFGKLASQLVLNFPFDEVDLSDWAEVLNRVDAFLEQMIKELFTTSSSTASTADTKDELRLIAITLPNAFPKQVLLTLLKFLATVLEHASRRHIFNSVEHLVTLFGIEDDEVTIEILKTLAVLVSKPHRFKNDSAATRAHGDHRLGARLFALAKGWGMRDQGLGLVATASEGPLPSSASAVTLEYFADKKQSGSSVNVTPLVDREVIHIDNAADDAASASAHATRLIQQAKVPLSPDAQFALFARLRFAKHTKDLAARLPLLRIRMLAAKILIEQSSFQSSTETLSAFLTQDINFIGDLVEVLRPETSVSDEVRLLALHVLISLIDDRSRSQTVRQALGWGTQGGFIPSILNLAIPALVAGEKHPVYTPDFVQTSLMVVFAILSSMEMQANSDSNVIASVVQLIGDKVPEHRKVVIAGLRVLEPLMDSHEGFGLLFKDLGGVKLAIDRLSYEIGHFSESNKKDMQQITKRLLRILVFLHSGAAVGMGRGTVIDASLLASLKELLVHHEKYGSVLFLIAASLVSGMIQNEPQCFPSILQSGIPAVVLEVIQTGRIPVFHEAIPLIPNVISAFCLNQEWLKSVASANPLPGFLSILLQPRYAVELQLEGSTVLGAAVDELFRHHPAIRNVGITACVDLLRKLHALASTEKEKLEEMAQSLECTPQDFFFMLILNTAKFLEPLVANSVEQSKLFLDSGGLEIMHQIYATDVFPVAHLIQNTLANQLSPVLALFGSLAMRHPATVLEATASAANKYLTYLIGMLPPISLPLVSLLPEAGKWPTLLRAVSTADAHLAMLTHMLRELSNTTTAPFSVAHGAVHRRLLWELSTNRYHEERQKALATPQAPKWYEVFEHLGTCLHDLNTAILRALANSCKRGDDKNLLSKAKNMALMLEELLTPPVENAKTSELLRFYVRALTEVRWLVFTDQPRHRIHVLLLWSFDMVNGTARVMEIFKKLCKISLELKQAAVKDADAEEELKLAMQQILAVFEGLVNKAGVMMSPITTHMLTRDRSAQFSKSFEPVALVQALQRQLLEGFMPLCADNGGGLQPLSDSFVNGLLTCVARSIDALTSEPAGAAAQNPRLAQAEQQLDVLRSGLGRAVAAAAGGGSGASRLAAFVAALGGATGSGSNVAQWPSGAAPPAVDEEMVQSLIDMGFTRPHVLAALRETGYSSAEAATEWLLGHPDFVPPPEPATPKQQPAPAVAPAPAATTPTPAAPATSHGLPAASDEEELARALALSLGQELFGRMEGAIAAPATAETPAPVASAPTPAPASAATPAPSSVPSAPVPKQPDAQTAERAALEAINKQLIEKLSDILPPLCVKLLSTHTGASQGAADVFRAVTVRSQNPAAVRASILKAILDVLLQDSTRAFSDNDQPLLHAFLLLLQDDKENKDKDRDREKEDKEKESFLSLATSRPIVDRLIAAVTQAIPLLEDYKPPMELESSLRAQQKSPLLWVTTALLIIDRFVQPPLGKLKLQVRADSNDIEQLPPQPLLNLPIHIVARVSDLCATLLRTLVQASHPYDTKEYRQALLSLLSRVTREHTVAVRLLKDGGLLPALLKLPLRANGFVGQALLVTLILRHFMEDDVTLEKAMIAELRLSPVANGWNPRTFFTQFSILAYRNPNIFVRAVLASCRISHGNIVLKPVPTPTSMTTSSAAVPHLQPHLGTAASPVLGASLGASPVAGSPLRTSKTDTLPWNGQEVVHLVLEQLIRLRTSQRDGKDASPSDLVLQAEDLLLILAEFTLSYNSVCARVLVREPHAQLFSGATAHFASVVDFVLREFICRPTSANAPAGDIQRYQPVVTLLLRGLCSKSDIRKRVVADLLSVLKSIVTSAATMLNNSAVPVTHDHHRHIQALAEIVHKLSKHSRSHHSHQHSAHSEIINALTQAGAVPALTEALAVIDLYHPDASAASAAILKPLDSLTAVAASSLYNTNRPKSRRGRRLDPPPLPAAPAAPLPNASGLGSQPSSAALAVTSPVGIPAGEEENSEDDMELGAHDDGEAEAHEDMEGLDADEGGGEGEEADDAEEEEEEGHDVEPEVDDPQPEQEGDEAGDESSSSSIEEEEGEEDLDDADGARDVEDEEEDDDVEASDEQVLPVGMDEDSLISESFPGAEEGSDEHPDNMLRLGGRNIHIMRRTLGGGISRINGPADPVSAHRVAMHPLLAPAASAEPTVASSGHEDNARNFRNNMFDWLLTLSHDRAAEDRTLRATPARLARWSDDGYLPVAATAFAQSLSEWLTTQLRFITNREKREEEERKAKEDAAAKAKEDEKAKEQKEAEAKAKEEAKKLELSTPMSTSPSPAPATASTPAPAVGASKETLSTPAPASSAPSSSAAPTVVSSTTAASAPAAPQPDAIDEDFLAALPDDIRAEVLASQGRGSRAAGGVTTALGANTDISAEFLAALPDELQQEILEQQRREESRRPAPADTSRAEEMDNASFIASLTPDLRREVLLTADDAVIASLPPQLAAEAHALRDRAHHAHPPGAQFIPPRVTMLPGGRSGVVMSINLPLPEGADAAQLAQALPPGMRMLTLPVHSFAQHLSGQVGSLGGLGLPGGVSAQHRVGTVAATSPPILPNVSIIPLLRQLYVLQRFNRALLANILDDLSHHPSTRAAIAISLLHLLSSTSCPAVPRLRSTFQFNPLTQPNHPLIGSVASIGFGESNPQTTHSGLPRPVESRILMVLNQLLRNNANVCAFLLRGDGQSERRELGLEAVDSGQQPPFELLLQQLRPERWTRVYSSNLEHLLQAIYNVVKVLPGVEDEESDPAPPAAAAGEGAPGNLFVVPAARPAQPRVALASSNAPAPASPAPSTTAGGAAPANQSSGAPAAAQPATKDKPADAPLIVSEDALSLLARVLCLGTQGSERAADLAQQIIRALAAHHPTNHERLARQLVKLGIDARKRVMQHLEVLVDKLQQVEGHTEKEKWRGALSLSRTLPNLFDDELALLRLVRACASIRSLHHREPAEKTTVHDLSRMLEDLRLDEVWDRLELSLAHLTPEQQQRIAPPQPVVANAAAAGGAGAGSLAISPLLQYLLPVIEVVFLTAGPGGASSHEDALEPPPSPGAASTASSSSLRAASSSTLLLPGLDVVVENSGGPQLPRPTGAVSKRFTRFAEKQRKLLNDLIRQNPALVEENGSFYSLLAMPRLLDFDNKRRWFRQQISKQIDEAGMGDLHISVRRNRIFDDSYHQLSLRTPAELRGGRLVVSFVGEEGIDAGGLLREWFLVLSREMFNPNYALFTRVALTYQPNRASYINPDHLSYFQFAGRVIGKAILDGQMVDAYFTRSIYKHILGVPISVQDMEAVDPEYYKNLKWILDNNITGILDLTFSAETDDFGKMKIVDLKPNGRNIPVTEENKLEYVRLITQHKMTNEIRQQIEHFLKGLYELMPRELLQVFNENELELLISGMPEIDMADLKQNTEYVGYSADSPTIQWFWRAVAQFGQEERALLVQFVTGTSKVPLEGFKALQGSSGPQKFQIHKVYHANRLPSAHTCFNQLDLPEYDSYDSLYKNLLLAIKEGSEGFGFG